MEPDTTTGSAEMEPLEPLGPGVFLLRMRVQGLLDRPLVERLIHHFRNPPPGARQVVLVDARAGVDLTPEARLALVQTAGSQDGVPTAAAAVYGASLLFRLSVTCVALAMHHTPVRAFSDEASARAWLERVAARVSSQASRVQSPA